MLGPMRDEDREAIRARARRLAAEAPELTEERRESLRRLVNPPKTPRPGGASTRGHGDDGPPTPVAAMR
jgi:hypothetical protein